MPIRKIWDHAIELKKGKVYLLLREKKEEVREFITE